jgi:hypothetical protein
MRRSRVVVVVGAGTAVGCRCVGGCKAWCRLGLQLLLRC